MSGKYAYWFEWAVDQAQANYSDCPSVPDSVGIRNPMTRHKRLVKRNLSLNPSLAATGRSIEHQTQPDPRRMAGKAEMGICCHGHARRAADIFHIREPLYKKERVLPGV